MRMTPVASLSLIIGALLLGATGAAAQAPTPAPGGAAPQMPGTLIGVVTRPGRANDAGVNQAITAGVRTGAVATGAAEPTIAVPFDREDVGASIQGLVDQGVTVIVTSPGQDAETAAAALQYPNVRFIGVDQTPPCLTPEGLPDSTGTCAGDLAALQPNYTVLQYAEDQAGYLAGIVAASLSETGRVAAIGGLSDCPGCIRYIQGFELGARSVDETIETARGFVTDTDVEVAFSDPITGRAYAEAFIDVYQPDVVMHAAADTGRGIIDAACEQGILAIGSVVDESLAYPRGARCILTSATKNLAQSVAASITSVAAGTIRGGIDRWDATRDGIGIAPFHDLTERVPSDVAGRISDAYAAMKRGALQTCPEGCGTLE